MKRIATSLARPKIRARGAAYTFMILMASIALLALGGSLFLPTRQAVELTSLRIRDLTGRNLADAGLEWAFVTIASGELNRTTRFNLSTGIVEVEILQPGKDQYQVRSIGTAFPKSPQELRIGIQATVLNKDGALEVTKVERLNLKIADKPEQPPK